MIQFSAKPLPYTERVYLAFRIAFLETMERLALAEHLELENHRAFGFLTQVPFLKSVPAQVQLDLLSELWDRHLDRNSYSANYLDEALVYAMCETASSVIRQDPRQAEQIAQNGPLPCAVVINSRLADQFQQLHLDFAGEGHYLLVSQYQDLPPQEAEKFKQQSGIVAGKCDSLFEALSRWRVRPGFEERACGLLTAAELLQLSNLADFANVVVPQEDDWT